MSEVFYLGIDGGGTTCRARVESADGKVLGKGFSGPATTRLGANNALLSVMAAAEAALTEAGLDKNAYRSVHAVIGIAGIERKSARTYFYAWPHPFSRVRFESDATIACLGAHHGNDGGIIIAGTGSIGFALLNGQSYRFGGYGFPISDEGSGADLGIRALRSALCSADGRIEKTPLLEKILARFSNDIGAVIDWMDAASPTDYASFAPLIIEYAALGDTIGVQLMRDAASQIETFIRVLHEKKAPRLSLIGGIAEGLKPWLSADYRALLSPALADPVSGAIMLAKGWQK
jgi:glucosamine kinase